MASKSDPNAPARVSVMNAPSRETEFRKHEAASQTDGGLINYPSSSLAEANKQFLRQLSSDSGSNIYRVGEKLITVLDYLMENFSQFTRDQVFQFARPFDLPVPEVNQLVQLWIRFMVKRRRIREVAGVYDQPLYERL